MRGRGQKIFVENEKNAYRTLSAALSGEGCFENRFQFLLNLN